MGTSWMNLADYADRRFRFAGRDVLGHVRHFMGSLDQLPAMSGNQEIVSFGNYDYLGLSVDLRVREAASEAALTMGAGVLASRLVGGERDLHRSLESALARFIGTEGALCLVSGYLTNVTVVGHLLGSRDLLLVDELSHNSIAKGAAASRALTLSFRHNDLDHLEELLCTMREQHGRCLIVVEGLYSMDGDVPDLPRLLRIRQRHDAWLMVDEAHSIGVLGASGRGLSEHWGTDPLDIDIIVGTLSKAFGTCGGFVGASQRVLEWFRYTLPGFVFSVGLSPPIAAAALRAVQLLDAEPWRVERLHANSRLFVRTARSLGLDVGPAQGQGVIPLLFRDNAQTVQCANALLSEGYYCPPIVQVGVPRDQPRLRFFLSALHQSEDISRALSIVAGATRMLPSSLPAVATG